LLAPNDVGELMAEATFLGRVQRNLIFDGVDNATQEIGISHWLGQWGRQLRNRQGKGSGNPLEQVILKNVVARRFDAFTVLQRGA
jgi:hypothetical protein